MTIEKGLIASEDINFGTATVQRRGQTGALINVTQVNASQLPVTATLISRLLALGVTAVDVEDILAQCQLFPESGSDAATYTNRSGASRSAGDVVIVSTGGTNSFTTTTTAGHTSVLGVVGETIANLASGKVITGGYCSSISVDSATAIGDFLRTSTTASKATDTTTATGGSFAIALSSTAGAGTVSAFIFGVVGQSFLPLGGGVLTGTLSLYKGTDVASQAALNPWASSNVGNYFDVTGTNTITSIAASNALSPLLILHFDGALTLTHHADNLILPGAVNIATSAGDELTFMEYASGQWRCIGYIDASTTGIGNIVRATSPTLTTPVLSIPVIADLTSATHTHANAAGGGNTLTTPTIASFANATHTHEAAASGGGLGNVGLKTKTVNIGDWNMDVTASVNVAHGLTLANIRYVEVLIINDTGVGAGPLDYDTSGSVGGYWTIDATNVVLTRVTAGAYDATDYDSTSYNRGYVTIWYV